MKQSTILILISLPVIALLTLAIYMTVSVWHECRADHSWFYCMELIGK